MSSLITSFLPIIIVLIGFGLVLGLPVGKIVKGIGVRWILFLALGLMLPLFPMLLNYIQNNPPQSLQEWMTWIGILLLILSLVFRLLFGAGFTGRLVEHLVFSALYDALKGFFNLAFKGLVKAFAGLLKGLQALLRLF